MPAQKPIILIGGGGHAKVVLDALLALGREVIGFTDVNPACPSLLGVKRLGGDEVMERYGPDQVELANGMGSTERPTFRAQMYERFKRLGFAFATVIHPTASLGREVVLGEGVQVMAGAVVQAGVRLAADVVINTRAVVEHDCVIGSHTHISPGAVLCGGVVVGEGSHIGATACLIQLVQVGRNCVVGAGAVVLKNVPDGQTVFGVPARPAAIP